MPELLVRFEGNTGIQDTAWASHSNNLTIYPPEHFDGARIPTTWEVTHQKKNECLQLQLQQLHYSLPYGAALEWSVRTYFVVQDLTRFFFTA